VRLARLSSVTICPRVLSKNFASQFVAKRYSFRRPLSV
jgi:hypothetical protein